MAKFGLGKGLGALIPQDENPAEDLDKKATDNGEAASSLEGIMAGEDVPKDLVQNLSVSDILPNPFQPRKNIDSEALQELAKSIKTHGILQPLVVAAKNGKYELISGERRLEA